MKQLLAEAQQLRQQASNLEEKALQTARDQGKLVFQGRGFDAPQGLYNSLHGLLKYSLQRGSAWGEDEVEVYDLDDASYWVVLGGRLYSYPK